jgi:UDP-N-acetylglucosamine:LPS N-acetylglucosamine transferase
MSETVYLRKPMLAMPVVGQFEQTLNALYLEREGYGRCARALDTATLTEFLKVVPRCEERLAAYSQDGNRLLLAALDEKLDAVACSS